MTSKAARAHLQANPNQGAPLNSEAADPLLLDDYLECAALSQSRIMCSMANGAGAVFMFFCAAGDDNGTAELDAAQAAALRGEIPHRLTGSSLSVLPPLGGDPDIPGSGLRLVACRLATQVLGRQFHFDCKFIQEKDGSLSLMSAEPPSPVGDAMAPQPHEQIELAQCSAWLRARQEERALRKASTLPARISPSQRM